MHSSSSPKGRRLPRISLIAIVAAVAGLAAILVPAVSKRVSRLEYWTADWRTALLADRAPPGGYDKITIVLFDPETFDGGIPSPIPRDVNAQVIRMLDSLEPRAVGADFWFTQSQGPEKDQALLDALRQAKTPIVLGAVDKRTKEFNDTQLAYQAAFLASAGRPAGHIHLKYDAGHMVRSTYEVVADSAHPESFSRLVAREAGATIEGVLASDQPIPIAWLMGADGGHEPFVSISAKRILALDESTRPEIERLIKGRVVLTGIDMPNADRHNTALSAWSDERMLGVMVHAHQVAQYLDGRGFTRLRGWMTWAFLGTVAAAGLLLSWMFWQRRFDFLSLGVATAALVAVDAFCYFALRTVLPLTLALYVWFFAVLAGHHGRALANWFLGSQQAPAPPRAPAPRAS